MNATQFADALIERSIASGLAVAVTSEDIMRVYLYPRDVVVALRSVATEEAAQGDFRGEGWRVEVWA